MKKIAYLTLTVLVLVPLANLRAAETHPVSVESLLSELADPTTIARYPSPAYSTAQASSRDRRSTTPDKNPNGWFANDDWSNFIRCETIHNRIEWVMMEDAGPGCIVRFWTGGKPATGTVRFYLDHSEEPSISAPLQDLLAGKSFVLPPLAAELPKESGNLYLPVPYHDSCRITYEEPINTTSTNPPPKRWYNIEYRHYAPGTNVQTFTREAYQSAIHKKNNILGTLEPDKTSNVTKTVREWNLKISPNQEIELNLPDGVGAVQQFQAIIKPDDLNCLRTTIISASFDGEETIWCPIGDFFGTGVGLNTLNSWTRSVTRDGTMTSRWVMPFQNRASFKFKNIGLKDCELQIKICISPWRWDNRSMHFHTTWHQQDGLPTRPLSDWNIVAINGTGVYAGDALCVYNPVPEWWGEGDEKIWVDGDTFPSHFGTGTEDYYGYAWGSCELFQHPFVNQIRCDGPRNQGNTVLTRSRSLDAIPFSKCFTFDLEVWHWKSCLVRYAATTNWYALPGATCNRSPEPSEAIRHAQSASKEKVGL